MPSRSDQGVQILHHRIGQSGVSPHRRITDIVNAPRVMDKKHLFPADAALSSFCDKILSKRQRQTIEKLSDLPGHYSLHVIHFFEHTLERTLLKGHRRPCGEADLQIISQDTGC